MLPLSSATEKPRLSRKPASIAWVGVTDYAQGHLGDIVMVEVPAVGDGVTAGDAFGTVESPKSVSDLFAPVSG